MAFISKAEKLRLKKATENERALAYERAIVDKKLKKETPKTPIRIATELDLYEAYKQVETLDEDKRDFVLKCFGEFMSSEVIKHQVAMTSGPASPLCNIKIIEMVCNAPKNRLRVMHHRNKYLNRLKDVALSHKRIRIDDLQYLRDRFLHQIKNMDDNDFDQRKEFRYMASGLAQILSQAQDEVEGKGININVGIGFGLEDMDGKSDDELISRRQELLAKAERAIAGNTQRRGIAGDSGDTTNIIEAQAVQSP